VLHKNGSVSILDENSKKKLATVPPTFGMEPAEMFSARGPNPTAASFTGRWGYGFVADGVGVYQLSLKTRKLTRVMD
jgi:hypothetical protein